MPALTRTLATVATAILLGGCAGSDPAPGQSGSTTTTAPPTASPTAVPSVSTDVPDEAEPASAVPVYYVGEAQSAPRLYREFHRLTVTDGDKAVAAVQEFLSGSPTDPDYSRAWAPGTELLSFARDGDVATVDLSAFVAVGAAYETAAVQALVHTVTAADPSVRAVRLLVDGAAPTSGHQDWSEPVARASPFDVLSQVWILAPTQGAATSSPLQVRVYGTGFEGNTPLRVVRTSDGAEVATTFVTTMMGGFREAETTIALPPGSYELRAYTDNAENGELLLWDSKRFTIS